LEKKYSTNFPMFAAGPEVLKEEKIKSTSQPTADWSSVSAV